MSATTQSVDEIIEKFHKLYYSNGSRTWNNTIWLGYTILKCPLDLFIYQEIIYQNKPDIIIETGTGCGGSTLFLASICDLINHGKVISVDLENTNHKETLPQHERITYVTGSSISESIINNISNLIKEEKCEKIMAILDSDHHNDHVLNELNIFSKMVTKDNYIIVEDSNLSGHPNYTDFEGPMEAIDNFLVEQKNKNFMIDESKHKYYLTFNPRGYLKRLFFYIFLSVIYMTDIIDQVLDKFPYIVLDNNINCVTCLTINCVTCLAL